MQPERKFIHDLATPLSSAIFRLSTLIESAAEGTPSPPELHEQLDSTLKLLEGMADQMRKRTTVILKQEREES